MKKNLLCIDDIESNIFTLQSVLDNENGSPYNIFTALSAQDAFKILLKEHIDLILLDVMMPEIDGFMTAKMILSNKKTKNIPIIFLTAKKDDETIDKCYQAGGIDYVTKPFNAIELLHRISLHLRLKERDEQLQNEKKFAQSILDLQENMIIVTNGLEALHVNQKILDFFNLKSIEDFKEKIQCIHSTFISKDGYFSLSSLSNDTSWIESIIKKSRKEDLLVKIPIQNNDFIFNIKASLFCDYYIITLTNVTQLSHLSLEYQKEANYDKLTQIYNRNMFYKLIDRKIISAKAQKSSFVFIIIDIDYFKHVNDTYGHLIGDEVLKSLAQLIKSNIRDNDIFARWGGEEFILALTVTLETGMKIANNLRKIIANKEFESIGHLTCSFGLTSFKEDDTLKSMTLRADKALYRAKTEGRNQVCQSN